MFIEVHTIIPKTVDTNEAIGEAMLIGVSHIAQVEGPLGASHSRIWTDETMGDDGCPYKVWESYAEVKAMLEKEI
jgi:hypothetical protein